MATIKSEREELKKMGAKPTRNSGRTNWEKGDGHLDPFTVDVKEYEKSYSVSRDNWGKICTDAARNGEEPAIMIALGKGKETVRVWVIGDTMFHQMRAAYIEKYGDIDG